jgi:hypothetical protein
LIKKIGNYDTISEYKNGGKKLKRKQTKTKKTIRRRTKNRKGIANFSRVKWTF